VLSPGRSGIPEAQRGIQRSTGTNPNSCTVNALLKIIDLKLFSFPYSPVKMNRFWPIYKTRWSRIKRCWYKARITPATFCLYLRLIIKTITKTLYKNINNSIMKTSIKTLATSVFAVIVLTSSIFASNVVANEKQPVKITAPSGISKVIVSGNVEVTLIQNGTEGVSYNDDNTGKVKVMQDGSGLKISSEDKALAKITVYVKNIYRIQASDDAVVKTEGKLDVKYLQVFLTENAVAKINSNTESLYTVIEDHSDLKLSGSTENHSLVMGKTQKLDLDRFSALKTELNTPEATVQTASLAK
jgi:hypothetical protein